MASRKRILDEITPESVEQSELGALHSRWLCMQGATVKSSRPWRAQTVVCGYSTGPNSQRSSLARGVRRATLSIDFLDRERTAHIPLPPVYFTPQSDDHLAQPIPSFHWDLAAAT